MDPVTLNPIAEFLKSIMTETVTGGYMILSTCFCIILYKHFRKIEREKSAIIDDWVKKYTKEVEENKLIVQEANTKYEELIREQFKIMKSLDKTLDKTIDALEDSIDE